MQSTEKIETVACGETTSAAPHRIRYWTPVVLYAGIIFYLSAQSHPEEQLPSFLLKEVSDKILHAVEYGILATLCYRAFRWAAGATLSPYAILLSIVTASFYGFTDEVHQYFVPLREASVFDWMADTVGTVIAAVGASRIFRRNQPHES